MERRNIFRKTCRHFRFQVPQDLADELRIADPEPCELCDPIMQQRGFFFSHPAPAEETDSEYTYDECEYELA